jgi:hypothetical protein
LLLKCLRKWWSRWKWPKQRAILLMHDVIGSNHTLRYTWRGYFQWDNGIVIMSLWRALIFSWHRDNIKASKRVHVMLNTSKFLFD